jgi:hypothetical protein
MAEKEIQAIMIVEVAGRPAEYVKQGLETHISRLDTIQDIEVISKNSSEPKRIEHQEEAYVCFSEIEFKVPSFQRLLDLIFDFMPSSIEIIHPGRIEMDSQQATTFVNNMAGRLHRYDELAKMAQFKIRELSEQLTILKNNQEKPKQEPSKKSSKKKSIKKKSKA